MPKILSISLILFSFCTLLQACETQVQKGACTFNISSKDINCISLTLQQCKWNVCTAWVITQDAKYCMDYKVVTKYSWTQCMNKCCVSKGPQTYAALDSCEFQQENSESNRQDYLVLFIFLGIGVGGIVIIVITCAWEKIKQKLISCKKFIVKWICCKNDNITPNQEMAPQILSNHKVSSNQLKIVDKWRQCNEQLKLTNETCSICLSISPNIQLKCKHNYHHECILKWVVRKNHCSICQRDIDNMTIYCHKCWKNKKDFVLNSDTAKLADTRLICEECTMQLQDH